KLMGMGKYTHNTGIKKCLTQNFFMPVFSVYDLFRINIRNKLVWHIFTPTIFKVKFRIFLSCKAFAKKYIYISLVKSNHTKNGHHSLKSDVRFLFV
ncbi:hypothetical protein P4I03_05155, partial [Bacillus cereus]|nr:hypothetical protein [Bacillus cereus]MEB9275511.1 hypothetical protein [Bacillus cereus]MEC2531924.1 hypothetical protein [Bacillus cereus]